MKLLRFGDPGRERPGVVDSGGVVRDVSSIVRDYDLQWLSIDGIVASLTEARLSALPEVDPAVRLGPPVANIGKIVCAGMNYADHCAEAGVPVPSEPAIFMKATSALCGPNDPTRMPRGATKLDWEAELAVVIGRAGEYIPLEEALEHVAGYTILNDISERAFQLERAGQWVKGKSCDTFAPLGPWLVTPDEVKNPQNLAITLSVNGETMQQGSTESMVFGVAHLIHYISQFMSLQPGDVISTGTPPGVGMGQKPQRWLQTGDRVRVTISGLGTQEQLVV